MRGPANVVLAQIISTWHCVVFNFKQQAHFDAKLLNLQGELADARQYYSAEVAKFEKRIKTGEKASRGSIGRVCQATMHTLVLVLFYTWLSICKAGKLDRRRKLAVIAAIHRSVKVDIVLYRTLMSWVLVMQVERGYRSQVDARSEQRSVLRHLAKQRGMEEAERMSSLRRELLLHMCIMTWWHHSVEENYECQILDEAEKNKSVVAHVRVASIQYGLRCNMVCGRLLIAWQAVVHANQYEKVCEGTAVHFKAAYLSRTRMHAERLGRWNDRVMLTRFFTFWQLFELFKSSVAKHTKSQTLGRAFMVKLQSKLLQQRFLYRWLWVCPPKPREVEFPQLAERQIEFSKSPPSFFVRPVSAGPVPGMRYPVNYIPSREDKVWVQTQNPTAIAERQHHSEDKVWVQTQNPTAIAERQHHEYRHSRPVSASLTRPSSNGQVPTASIQLTEATEPSVGTTLLLAPELAPGQRYAMAAEAATSDLEYTRLFEHNRREITEDKSRCLKCGRRKGPIDGASPSGIDDLGIGFCVCHKVAAVGGGPASAEQIGQGVRSTNRPQSARPTVTS
jgi:hypothetical protein